MRKLIIGGVIVVLLAVIAGVGALQYATQLPVGRAVDEIILYGTLAPSPMEVSALGIRGEAAPASFGPIGPGEPDSKVCYDPTGRPLSREDASMPGVVCSATGRLVWVFNTAALVQALASAQAGDAIRLAPGDYEAGGTGLKLGGAGRPGAPITVGADRLGEARLSFSTLEGLAVQQPYWVFQNLDIEGVCRDDKDCEHAFHVTGAATGTIIRNNRLRNFNAAIKINKTDVVPDDVLIEHNLIFNDKPRETTRPVTLIDAVATDRLHVVANVLADFARNGGDRVSYGAFAKGGGSDALFERNLVICEWRHRGGSRVGLSLGGGGTDDGLCRAGRCGFEQKGGVIRANIVANCGNAGIYLRHAPDSRVENNIVRATRGVEGRFSDTRGRLVNNVIDGRVLGWDGARLDRASNIASIWRAALLKRSTDGVFERPARGDFAFRSASDATRRGVAVSGQPRDYCGNAYDPNAPPIGPFEQSRGGCQPRVAGLN